MKTLIRTLGKMLVSIFAIAIPMLLVIGFYENWPDFIQAILILLFTGDVIVVGLGVNVLEGGA